MDDFTNEQPNISDEELMKFAPPEDEEEYVPPVEEEPYIPEGNALPPAGESSVSRTMPSDRVSEESVIGAMIMDRDAIVVATEMLTAQDFYFEQCGYLFQAISDLYQEGKSIDPVTIQSKFHDRNLSDSYANVEYINLLLSKVPASINIRDYCEAVKNKAMLRSIIKMNQAMELDCYKQDKPIEDILDGAEKDLSKLISERGIADEVPIQDVVINVLNKIQTASEQDGNVTGVATGFIDLDYKTAGFQPSDLILIAARPSMGKTALALNIADYVALKEQKTVAIFSLEMSREQLVNRLIALESTVDAQRLRNGNLKEADWDRILQGAGAVAKSHLIIDDTPAISVSELRTKCRKFKAENNLSMVMIDYLQLMTVGRNIDSKQQEISEISRSLKAIARELNVPVVALSQLNRGVEQRDDKRPMLSDLRDSGAIEQDADVVMFIYRDDYYHKDSPDKGISELIIAKQRNGPVGTVRLAWMPETTRFANAELKGRNDS